ncbi:hypothetical protein FOIG_10701 [Fusarium odoratissimum NRRL 54006]|uniref:Uncharacterized protein n=2 Tax=Fusarium oxysporum species complex TaxID=171631 RepID=X0J797_FUSO5|nr:uncharacterized protein FOIG_10701 [Fusarium odoratissimum NRRL 54006]EXL97002.1 hypothetical protein FOIG_10701 [Fusarium odoratissimum NRRL 54006]TXC00564.1 hypothetical protein FocTR4_00008923 [Fusarium oxysporum f. sp. cubense]
MERTPPSATIMNQFVTNQDQMTWSAQASLKTITYMLQLQLQNRTVVVSNGYKIRRLVKSTHPCLVKRSPPHVASPTVEEVIQTSIYHPRFSTRTTDIGRPVRVLNILFAILGIRSLQHSTAQQHSTFTLKEKLSPVGQDTHIVLSLGLPQHTNCFLAANPGE